MVKAERLAMRVATLLGMAVGVDVARGRPGRMDRPKRHLGSFVSLLLIALGVLTVVVVLWRAVMPDDPVVQADSAALDTLMDAGQYLRGGIRRAIDPAIARTGKAAAEPDVIAALRTGTTAALTAACNRVLLGSTEIDAIALFDAKGHIVALNTVYASGAPVAPDRVARVMKLDFGHREIVQRCVVNHARTTSLEFQTTCDITPALFDSSGLSIACSSPVVDPATGRTLGVVSSRLRFERLFDLQRSMPSAGGHVRASYVSDRGTCFSEAVNSGRSPPPVEPALLAAAIAPMARGDASCAFTRHGADWVGLFRLNNFKTIEGGGIQVMLLAKASWVGQEARAARRLQAGTAVALAALLVLLGALLRSVRSIRALHAKAADSVEKLDILLDAGGVGSWEFEPATDAIRLDARCRAQLGMRADQPPEIAGSQWRGLIHPGDLPAVLAALGDHTVGRTAAFSNEHRARHADGSWRWFSTFGKVVARAADGSATRIVGAYVDVTARKAAEQQLETVIDAGGLGVWDYDVASGSVQLDARAMAMLGRDAGAGRTTRDEFLALVHPDDVGALVAALDAHLADRTPAVVNEHRLRHAGGHWRWFRTYGRVVARGADGVATRAVGAYSDITDQRADDARRAQSQRLESIGQLAAGIAHEINTPAQYVGDNVRFLQDQFAALMGLVDRYAGLLDPTKGNVTWDERRRDVAASLAAADYAFLKAEVPAALAQSLEGLTRMSTIVLAMRDFSHPGSTSKEPADLNRSITSTVEVCRHRWKYAADVTLALDEAMPRVPCLVAEFNQVILNLVVNAADAIAEGEPAGATAKGTITVATRVAGGEAEVTVTDNGPGMPEAVQRRLFEPFFTTKPVGKGTGQGLALSRDVIVNKHGGRLTFESAVGRGTTFTIRLPLAASGAGQVERLAHQAREAA
jgi:PAS domain S-box-containing protein